MTSTLEHSQVHATFVVERTYPVPVERVWHALSDNDARDQWFGAGDAFAIENKSHDFRVGGHGIETGQWHGGPASTFHSTYTDIVELRRMVFTYDMWVDGAHMSTSLTTIVLEPVDGTTRLTYTEQGVHFEGLDSPEGREEGTRGLLDQLGALLAARPVTGSPLRSRPWALVTIPAHVDTTSTVFLAAMHLTAIPIAVLAIVTMTGLYGRHVSG